MVKTVKAAVEMGSAMHDNGLYRTGQYGTAVSRASRILYVKSAFRTTRLVSDTVRAS